LKKENSLDIDKATTPSFFDRLHRLANDPFEVLNGRYAKHAGGLDRPAFYDIDKIYPTLRLLDQNYRVMREELETLLAGMETIPRYHDLAKSESYISGSGDPEKNWRVFMLRSMVGTPRANQMKCPSTTALLRKIPNIYQAFFSILDAKKSVPAHAGGYLGYLRYHLGLRVPKNHPPTMRVRTQCHTWVEGQSILFDDSLEHEVYNDSDGVRVVLIVDILRPLPFHLHAVNSLLTHVVFRHSEEAKEVMANIKKHSLAALERS